MPEETEQLVNAAEQAKLKYPERSSQIDRLDSLLFAPGGFIPTGIYCYGPPSTGKTAVLKELLSSHPHSVIINCVEIQLSPQLAFSKILDALAHIHLSYLHGFDGSSACGSIEEFGMILHELCEASHDRRIVVLDHIEQLKDPFASLLLPAMLKVSELVQSRLVIVLTSNQVYDQFTTRTGNQPPIEILFNTYTRQQMLDILARDCPVDCDFNLFKSLCDLVYGSFYKPCRDLAELRHVIRLLLPKYLEPITQGRLKAPDGGKLFNNIKDYLKEALNNLYLRKVPTGDSTRANDLIAARRPISRSINLPIYTKYLLIAAFIASYNPARLDLRFFTKEREASKRRKGAGKDKTGGKLRPQLVGPKAFPVERQMAIFHSIVGDEIQGNVDLQIQNTSLITLRLLTRVTAADRLDGVKCKCNVSFDTIQGVARSVKFDIAKYLYDFQ